MSKSWQNIVLVMCLALLQSIAPLLHAHVHDLSIPGKIHFHTLEVDLADTPVQTGVYQLKTHLADEDAIGMESVEKNEFDISVTDVTALVSRILVALIPVSPVFIANTPVLMGALASPPYLRPLTLAPPATRSN